MYLLQAVPRQRARHTLSLTAVREARHSDGGRSRNPSIAVLTNRARRFLWNTVLAHLVVMRIATGAGFARSSLGRKSCRGRIRDCRQWVRIQFGFARDGDAVAQISPGLGVEKPPAVSAGFIKLGSTTLDRGRGNPLCLAARRCWMIRAGWGSRGSPAHVIP